jgi:hypothetical protein
MLLFPSFYCGTSIATIPNQTTTNASYVMAEPELTPLHLRQQILVLLRKLVRKSCHSQEPPTVTISSIACLIRKFHIHKSATVTNCGTQSLTYEWSFLSGTPATATTANPELLVTVLREHFPLIESY